MKIAVIVPTRGRPQSARRLQDAFDATCADDETSLIFGLDEDDPELENYKSIGLDNYDIGPRLRMAGTLNAIARRIAPQVEVVGFMGDDHLPRTNGWDDVVRQNMIPGGVLYGNDLIQGPNLPTEVFLDAEIVRKLGVFVPEGLTHLFLDNTWKTWGERTGKLIYLDHMIIEHLHPIAQKSEWDAGYVEVNDGAVWAADEARYNDYVSNGELDRDLEILRSIT